MHNTTDSKLSVCMIVKNEESILARCLQSIVPIADELVVVDTGSIDSTIAIAQSFGAIVIPTTWTHNFSHARNISLRHANHSWLLWLDADDVVPQESLTHITALKQEVPDKVYGMIVKNQKPNGTGSVFNQARMFPNHPDIFFERSIHEQIMPRALRVGLQMVRTKVIIEHYGYAHPETTKKKAQRNLSLLLHEFELNKGDIVLQIEIADSYSILTDQANAQKWYEQIIGQKTFEERFPTIVSQAYMGLGNIFNTKENYSQGLIHHSKAHELCPVRTDVLYCMAVSLDMLGEKEKSVTLLYKILSMEPVPLQVSIDYRQSNVKAYLRLGRLLHELNKQEKLLKVCRCALRVHNNQPEIYNMVGTAYFQVNRILDALHMFEKSIKIVQNGNIDAYIGLCMIYLKANRIDTTRQTIQHITPYFQSLPRFWAFISLTPNIHSEKMIPHTISVSQLNQEKMYLQKTFLLPI